MRMYANRFLTQSRKGAERRRAFIFSLCGTLRLCVSALMFPVLAAFGQGRVAYESYVDGKVQSVQSTANNAAAQVRALNGVVTGDDFALVVTNYDSVTRMPSLSARYKLQDGSGRYGEIWNELTRWEWFFGTWWPSNAYTKAQADARFADKAWGQYESGTGYDSPDGRLWVTQPVVMSSGMAYMPHTMESGGAIWVLTANGLAPSVTTNGFFRLSDDTGETLFEVVKGDKELVGAYCSDIKTQSQPSAPPIVTLEFAVDSPPTVEATVHLGELAEWQDIPEAWTSTTKTDNGYKVVITPPAGAVQYYFFRGKYERGTESYIRNLAPVKVDSGFVVTKSDGTSVKIRPVVNGTTVTWEIFE